MPANGLGTAITKLREKRTLSIRELSTLADVDHAYVYRLENGEKTNPSEDAVERLLKGLRPPERDAKMLRWLAQRPETDSRLVVYVLEDTSVSFEEFTVAAATVHRGPARPDPGKLIERVRRILSEDDE